jgi:4-hydroxy-4-methyl-2-oxoglutarate aldolase
VAFVIEDPPILRIRRDFLRPSKESIVAFGGAATGHVVDAMGGVGALGGHIRPLSTAMRRFYGIAITCDAGPADNLALFGALQVAQPGDVIVAATGGYLATAVAGELLIGMASNCGISALVTDGAMRDVSGIQAVGLPVCCAGISANSPSRNGPGTVGLPIIIGGVAVDAGDIIIGDGDGVVVVPRAQAEMVISRLAAVRAAEAALKAKVKSGLRIPESIVAVLNSAGVEELP